MSYLTTSTLNKLTALKASAWTITAQSSNEENCRIYAEIGLPYALGFFFGDYDNLKDFVDELVKRIEIIDVKEIAEENCNDKLDDPYNMNFPNIEKEMAEVTDIKRQLLQFCEVLKSFVKGL